MKKKRFSLYFIFLALFLLVFSYGFGYLIEQYMINQYYNSIKETSIQKKNLIVDLFMSEQPKDKLSAIKYSFGETFKKGKGFLAYQFKSNMNKLVPSINGYPPGNEIVYNNQDLSHQIEEISKNLYQNKNHILYIQDVLYDDINYGRLITIFSKDRIEQYQNRLYKYLLFFTLGLFILGLFIFSWFYRKEVLKKRGENPNSSKKQFNLDDVIVENLFRPKKEEYPHHKVEQNNYNEIMK